jgi:hypothetical protein
MISMFCKRANDDDFYVFYEFRANDDFYVFYDL